MTTFRFRSLFWTAAFAIASLTPAVSHAQLRLGGVRTEIIPDPNFRYHFELTLDAGTFVKGGLSNGDFFTIYDVPGILIGTNVQPNNWAAVSWSDSGLNPIDPPPPGFDDPLIPNVTFRFIAPGGETIDVPPGESSIVVGEFSVQALQDYAQETFKLGSQTSLPGGGKMSYYEVFAVPEPSAALLMGSGLAGLTLAWRFRRPTSRTAHAR